MTDPTLVAKRPRHTKSYKTLWETSERQLDACGRARADLERHRPCARPARGLGDLGMRNQTSGGSP